MTEELDRKRVEAMTQQMMSAVVENYRAGPSGRDRVLEALNACAMAAGYVIAGCGSRDARRDARRFFDKALDANIKDAAAAEPPPAMH